MPSSATIPPFTNETFAWAEPPPVSVFVNTMSSPISYPDPALSTKNSVIEPRPISSILILAPEPPPVIPKDSPVVYKAPSFVIDITFGIPVVVAFIKISDSSVSVPLITSPVWKVPDIVSSFKINSVTKFSPIWNLNTFSTMAVASEVSPVIVLPTKSAVSPVVNWAIDCIALIIFLVSNCPSEALNICSLG